MDLNDFITRHAATLIANAQNQLQPLYRCGDPLEDVAEMLRKPYKAQHEVITAAVKAMARQKGVSICAEMGTGKTIMAITAAHRWAVRRSEKDWNHIYGRPSDLRRGSVPDPKREASRRGRLVDVNPYFFLCNIHVPTGTWVTINGARFKTTGRAVVRRCDRAFYGYIPAIARDGEKLVLWSQCKAAYRMLVACPGQLVSKWAREITTTVPQALVYRIDSWRQMYEFWQSWKARKGFEAPAGHVWLVIGRDRLKLSHAWEPRFAQRSVLDGGLYGRHCCCPACHAPIYSRSGHMLTAADAAELARSKRSCERCGEPLWQSVSKPYRISPASLLHRMKGFLDVSIFDEMHEYKGLDSLQGQAMGAVAKVSKKVIGLTGTLSGGYAWHTFANLYRMGCASSLIEEGIHYDREPEFTSIYGRQEVTITTKASNNTSKRYGRGAGGNSSVRQSKTTKAIPGVMPQLVRHLLDSTIFLSLNDLDANLPYIDETIYPCDMDDVLEQEYRSIEQQIRQAIINALRDGRMTKSMLSLILVLLQYPDYPFGWDLQGFTVRNGKDERFVPVVQPKDLPSDLFYAKEREFVSWAENMVDCHCQVWGYVLYTQKRDCIERLRLALEQKGLRVSVLRSSVPPEDREDWIAEHGPKSQVILSHPALVQTGLDFFGPKYNFNAIGFYQCGYNPFIVRQASRRAWRLGQTMDCYVSYFLYSNTLQEKAMSLMQQKIATALSLEGKNAKTGITEYVDGLDESVEMLLAKTLVGDERIVDKASDF